MGENDFFSGADSGPTAAASIWNSLPSLADVVDKLGTAGLTRAAYEINRPMFDAAGKTRSPEGLLGRVGTVGVELGDGTKALLLAAAAVAAIYFLTR